MANDSGSSPGDRKKPAEMRSFTTSMRLGRLLGIDIHLDLSLIIIFFLIVATLGMGTFPAWHPDWSMLTTWLVAGVAAVAFLLSVLAHELSHAVVGRALGTKVRGITLFMFGGVASMEEESRSPQSEFWMTIVGPLTSLAIGLLGIWLAVALGGSAELAETDPEKFMHELGPVATVLAWLGPINILLAVFNMIPGFPLDGGRVLRALLWWITGDFHKATLWASRTGQGFGYLFVGLGFFMALGGSVPFFGRGFFNGVWLALIGWFLSTAARASYMGLVRKEVLSQTTVGQLMRKNVESVNAHSSVAELVEGPLMQTDQRSFPVYDGPEWVGVVTIDGVRQVSRAEWDRTRVEQLMIPASQIPSLRADSDAESAFQQMLEERQDQLPVMDHGEIRGFLRQTDVLKWLSLQESEASEGGG